MLRRWRLLRLRKLEERRLVLKEYYLNYAEGYLLASVVHELYDTEVKIETLRRKING